MLLRVVESCEWWRDVVDEMVMLHCVERCSWIIIATFFLSNDFLL